MAYLLRHLVFAIVITCSLSLASIAQSSDMCIVEQPLPKLPDDYGTLDAIASFVFRVEFREDGRLGKISPVSNVKIGNLQALAGDAVDKISFTPKIVDGKPIGIHKVIEYKYSWEYGWRITRLKSQKYCPRSEN